MRKMKWKRAAALLMASVMMVSMVACGKKDKDSSSGSKQKKENKKEMTYEESDLSVEGIEGDIVSYVVEGDRIYFYTTKWVEGDGSEDTTNEELNAEDTSAEGVSDEDATEADTSEEADTEESSEDSEDTTEADSTEEDSEDVTEDTSTEEDSEDATEEDNTEDGSAEEEYTGRSYYYVYSMKIDGTDLQDLGQPEVDENTYIGYMLVKSDGNIEFLLGAYDDNSGKQSYIIASFDESGKETDSKDITKDLGLDANEDNYLNKALIDNEDRYVFVTNSAITVFDKDFKKVCEMKPDSGYVDAVAKTKDGKIVVGDSSGEDGAKVQVLDVDTQKWGESYKMDFQYFSSSDALMNGIEYDFYYKDDSGIYGYDIASKKVQS